MFRSDIERIVDKHIEKRFENDTFTKAELRDVLVDILMSYGQSEVLSDAVENNISRKLRRKR